MNLWRKIALLLVVFGLVAGGSGFAMPAHDDPQAAMPAGCDEMADDAPMTSSDPGASADPVGHGCCATKGCACVVAHGVALFAALPATPMVMPVAGAAARLATRGYASPALARLTRPPIP